MRRPVFERYRRSVLVVVEHFGIDLDLDAQLKRQLVHGVVEMCPVNHVVRGVKFPLKVWDELGHADGLAVLPSPEGDVTWLDNLAG